MLNCHLLLSFQLLCHWYRFNTLDFHYCETFLEFQDTYREFLHLVSHPMNRYGLHWASLFATPSSGLLLNSHYQFSNASSLSGASNHIRASSPLQHPTAESKQQQATTPPPNGQAGVFAPPPPHAGMLSAALLGNATSPAASVLTNHLAAAAAQQQQQQHPPTPPRHDHLFSII